MNPPAREPVPGGLVSTIRGRWQSPALTWVTRLLLVTGVASAVAPGRLGTGLGVATVVVVVAVPLLRVAWLIFRWGQERDRRFVVAGVGLLGIVLLGALLAALGQ